MPSKKYTFRILIILSILIVPSVAYLILSSGKNNYSHLEIFGPKEPVSDGSRDTIYHTIAPFQLLSHTGNAFSSANLDGKIYVADFFFSTCKTICPKMTMQMKRVQEAYTNDPDITLVSFTVNPERDSAAVLSAYAEEYGARPGKWYFLTGEKVSIYDLARNSFFITALQGNGGPDDFIHSEKVVLVDKDKRIRGYYDGTDYEDINTLIEDIRALQWEYKESPLN